MQRATIKPINDDAQENISLSDTACVELRDVCKVCWSLVSGRKDDLLSRLMPFVEALSMFDGHNANENLEGFDSNSCQFL